MDRHASLFWTPCVAHCLGLILEDLGIILEDLGKITWIKACMEIAKNIFKFTYNHTWALNLMKQFTQKELAPLGITQFATNCHIKTFASSKGSFEAHVS